MKEPMVKQKLFDEAIRVGTVSADHANRNMLLSRGLLDAIEQTLGMMKIGRITQARERLERALVAAAKLLT